MCNNSTPSAFRRSSMIHEDTTKPARKIRTKTRKPNFLSLRHQLSLEKARKLSEMSSTNGSATQQHQQLNLFPLQPENIVRYKDTQEYNVACFFCSSDGGASSSLTGILGAAGTTSSEEDVNRLSQSASPSPSLTYAFGGQDREQGELVRTALRRKQRETGEEKWVCYFEVVERKEEEVTSCAADLRSRNRKPWFSLKLDYQGVMNAWSDKGPLYIHIESPQIVPGLHDDFLAHDSTYVPGDSWGSKEGLWRVPEMGVENGNGSIKVKEEVAGGEDYWKMVGQRDAKKMIGQREASVLRYKEKKQNRLFSKKVRYEVRKLNAEKRPRIKGRFVKRS